MPESYTWFVVGGQAKHAQHFNPQRAVLQIGPRLELEVVKVEEGLCEGKVLYHSFVQKSAGEAAQQKRHLTEKQMEDQLRAKRRHQQVCMSIIQLI